MAVDELSLIVANLADPEHGRAVVALIDTYASDPQGQRSGLSGEVRESLVPGLRDQPTSIVFLAFAGERPVGAAVCFRGYSTFAARPLLNLHDLVVHPEFRGRGIGGALLERVESHARELGCCKVTLEVSAENPRAHALYRRLGFDAEGASRSFFLHKPL